MSKASGLIFIINVLGSQWELTWCQLTNNWLFSYHFFLSKTGFFLSQKKKVWRIFQRPLVRDGSFQTFCSPKLSLIFARWLHYLDLQFSYYFWPYQHRILQKWEVRNISLFFLLLSEREKAKINTFTVCPTLWNSETVVQCRILAQFSLSYKGIYN